MGMLAAALRRHRCGGPLEDLERLLHPLAGDVASDRRVVGLAGDLVDLVDVDDLRLGLLHVEVGGLDQLQQDVLDVLADVAGLGERGGVGDRERTLRIFARVWASSVLPQPVGPSSRMFDFCSSISDPRRSRTSGRACSGCRLPRPRGPLCPLPDQPRTPSARRRSPWAWGGSRA